MRITWEASLALLLAGCATAEAGRLLPTKPGERYWYCATRSYAAIATEAEWDPSGKPTVWLVLLESQERVAVRGPVHLPAEAEELACGDAIVQVRTATGTWQLAASAESPLPEPSGAVLPRSKGEHRGLLKAGRVHRLPDERFALALLRASTPLGGSDADNALALFVLTRATEQLVFVRQWLRITVE